MTKKIKVVDVSPAEAIEEVTVEVQPVEDVKDEVISETKPIEETKEVEEETSKGQGLFL